MTGGLRVEILFFFLIIAATLAITYWAARRTNTADSFYAANRSIKGWQNGFAIAGDFMSAALLLGISGLFYSFGFDAIIYILVPPAAFGILLFLIADRLRNLGRYTFTDVISLRLGEKPARVFAATSTLISAIMYLVAQMVGAGALTQVLFGIPYGMAVTIVGVLMVLYVAFGGMLATTWVQITKAVLLVLGVAFLTLATLWRFGFDLSALYDAAAAVHPLGMGVFAPGGMNFDLIAALSLFMALTFGLVGSPHILMRFFTVPDAHHARVSAFVASAVVSLVLLAIAYVIGYGAIALVMGNPDFINPSGQLIGGNNMVAIHLSRMVGGEIFFGIIAAVAFATILAVVAGLTLASASAVSHDIYANVVHGGAPGERKEVRVSRIATLAIGAASIFLGIAFAGQNIAYLVSLALSVAASANFPVLLLSLYWRGLTTRGAIWGGGVGLLSAVAFVVLGPAVWVEILGNPEPIFPYAYPGIFSMAAAFITIWLVSTLDRSGRAARDRENFDRLEHRSLMGQEEEPA